MKHILMLGICLGCCMAVYSNQHNYADSLQQNDSILRLLKSIHNAAAFDAGVDLNGRINDLEVRVKELNSSSLAQNAQETFDSNYVRSKVPDTIPSTILSKYPATLYRETMLKASNWHGLNIIQFIVACIIQVLFLYKGFQLARRTSLCRDESYYKEFLIKLDKQTKPYYTDEMGNDILLDIKFIPPYSYSRVQLFWWTIIILSCCIVFFALTGVILPLNATAVLLLGLGVMVLATGRIIDKRQIDDKAIKKGTRIQDINSSQDFLSNILSDEKGISLHRFQALVFNVIFGVGYIAYFCKSFDDSNYPLSDFNEWQFTLLGISAATFLGLKAVENQGNTLPAATNNQEATASPKEDISNSEQHDR